MTEHNILYFTELKSQRTFFLVFFFGINVDLAIFQPYLDLEAGDNQSLKIQVARPGIEPRSSCSASQELNHSATAAPQRTFKRERGGVYVFLPRSIFLASLSVTLELMRPLLFPLYWT